MASPHSGVTGPSRTQRPRVGVGGGRGLAGDPCVGRVALRTAHCVPRASSRTALGSDYFNAQVKSFLSGHKLQSSTLRFDWHYGYTLHILSRREWMLFCCCLVPPLATVFARLARVGAQA